MNIDEDFLEYYWISSDFSLIKKKFSLSTVRYAVEIEYFNRPDRETPGATIWYMHSGLGLISHKFDIDILGRHFMSGEIFDFSSNYSETKFFQTLGGGVIQMLEGEIGLDIGANIGGWTRLLLEKLDQLDEGRLDSTRV